MDNLVLLVVFGVFAAVPAQNVAPCMTSRADCTMASSIRVVNNNYQCCRQGYTMYWVNGNCTCAQTAEVRDCDVGRPACDTASSFSTNSNGYLRCCPPGFSMQSISGFLNGRFMDSCTCTRYFASSVVFGGGNVLVSGGDPNFNATAFNQQMAKFRQGMQDWRQRFSSQMQAMGQQLRSSLQGVGHVVRRSMQDMRSRLYRGLFGPYY